MGNNLKYLLCRLDRQWRKSLRAAVRASVVAPMLALLVVVPVFGQVSPSQFDYTRTDLDWYTIETENFRIHFHMDEEGRGSSRTAQVIARVAEEVYEPVTSLYDYRPDARISVILKDFEDYSNGAAYFFDNVIEIWAPSLDSPLRGDHSWLRNVFTHEFTHMVQLQKAMKASRRRPVTYLQWMAYEDVKRPDVLYGYPNRMVSYPFPVINTPVWLAEGTAQYQRAGLHYDGWDAHRDMLLRTRILDGKEFSLADMGGFYSHTSLEREAIYNQGYAFTRYLAETYGEESLRDISEQLSQWRNYNIERAITAALGTPASIVYDNWLSSLREAYADVTEDLVDSRVGGDVFQTSGFANYYPRYSPDGSKIAYISNRGQDFNLLSLYVQELETGRQTVFDLEGLKIDHFGLTCTLGERLRPGVEGTFAWHPDGETIVFARLSDTRMGHRYSDLYTVNVTDREIERLTREERAAAPAYSPDGKRIVFVRQEDGSTNLFEFQPEDGSTRRLTDFRDGTQAGAPIWRPGTDWIYFTKSGGRGRSLYRVHRENRSTEEVLSLSHEVHNPTFDRSGSQLYFAADASGIFNLYRAPVDDPGAWEQLTNVVGGAFMPDVGMDGAVVYAEFSSAGYQLAILENVSRIPAAGLTRYESPAYLRHGTDESLAYLNAFDDSDLLPLDDYTRADLREKGEAGVSISTKVSNPADAVERMYTIERYRDDFTSFQFYPVIRLDEYVTTRRSAIDARIGRRGYGQRLLRNTKVGTYVASREVLNGLNFFGGLLVGPASGSAESASQYLVPDNLIKMERDLFLQFEYNKGLPFIRGRWSPQLAVELFNIRRNVERGIAIEEFACTACYPDTTYADVAYSLYEANFMLRSKISQSLLLEAGYRYSPYQVRVERFFSREHQQTVPGSSTRYFIGSGFLSRAYFEGYRPHRHSNMVPEGMHVELGYEYMPGRLLDRFDVEDGMLIPRYDRFNIHRFSVDARLNVLLPGSPLGGVHGAGIRMKASTILGGEVDNFFNDYAGGLVGARGYPFYALGGNEIVWFQASYHFPLFPRIHRQFLFVYADKLYGRVYADAAAAWSGSFPGFGQVRRDVGAELRLGVGSFYLFPTALFVSATYGLDSFDVDLDEGFLTPDGRTFVRYGRELLWHFGILFSFDL